MSTFTHSVKKTIELPCLGILKHGNYDLTIRWMYVLSTDTPTIVRAQLERRALAVARTKPSFTFSISIFNFNFQFRFSILIFNFDFRFQILISIFNVKE